MIIDARFQPQRVNADLDYKVDFAPLSNFDQNKCPGWAELLCDWLETNETIISATVTPLVFDPNITIHDIQVVDNGKSVRFFVVGVQPKENYIIVIEITTSNVPPRKDTRRIAVTII